MMKGGGNCYFCTAPAVAAYPRCGSFVCDDHRHRDRLTTLALCDLCRESVASLRWTLSATFAALLLAAGLLVIGLLRWTWRRDLEESRSPAMRSGPRPFLLTPNDG